MDPEEIINKLEQLNVSSKELDVSESGRLEMLSQVSDYINLSSG